MLRSPQFGRWTAVFGLVAMVLTMALDVISWPELGAAAVLIPVVTLAWRSGGY
ncbi:MAG: hypothetical protein R3C44_21250 [Chloroflexota bacterium]